MELDSAIKLLRNAVKNAGNVDQKHIDLSLVPVGEKPQYERALVVTQMAVKDGKLTRDELLSRLQLT